MAEEIQNQEPEAKEEPHGEPSQEVDWKAEARKWEMRSKANAQAALELEALKQAQMTEQEKANARAEKAEAALAELQALQAKSEAAKELAKSEGVPLELLEYCDGPESMAAFAKAYKALNPEQPAHSAASATSSRIVKSGENKAATRDQFADFVNNQLRKGI